MLFYFSKDKYADKSSKDLKELIEQYKESETDLLQFDFTKREKAREVGFIIFKVAEHLNLLKDGKSKYTLEQEIEELNKAQDLLNQLCISMIIKNYQKEIELSEGRNVSESIYS